MARVARDITWLIGRTPMVELLHISPPGKGRIVAKLEGMNPSRSNKDRIALAMIEDGEMSGRIRPGTTLVEPTGGNTGVALALVACARGYPLFLTMPEGIGSNRIAMLESHGAQVILTPAERGMRGAIEEAERIARTTPDCVLLQQFTNKANPRVHRETTAREIWEDLDGQVDCVVAGVGTGGTITGCGQFLKARRRDIRMVAVEPAESPVLSGGKAGPHGLTGLGAGFVPEVLDMSLVDEVLPVSTEEACSAARRLARVEALLVGVSSGAVCHAAELIARRADFAGRNVVAIFGDAGERYANHPVFQETVPPGTRGIA
jgi:cysteine synthase A